MGIERRKPKRAWITLPFIGAVGLLAVTLTGCNPTISLYGIYVPGWPAAGIAGFVLSYVSVGALARFTATRPLGESGVFFCSLGGDPGLFSLVRVLRPLLNGS